MSTSSVSHTGKTYLVTGSAGFIGSHLCEALLKLGAQVIGIDCYNDFYPQAVKEANTAVLRQQADAFHEYRIDFRNTAQLQAVFEQWTGQITQVIHLGALAGVRPSIEQPEAYLQTNVQGTLNILQAMHQQGIPKLVFASSSSVYGNRSNPPFREDDDISRPISPYAATKAMGEALIHTYSHLYGIQAVILRFFTVYGPRQRPDLAIHKFARAIVQGQPIPVYGDGSTLRDYTYISDILQGILGALDYTQSPYEIFNLGEAQPIALHQLITLLEAALGKSAIIERCPMQPGDVAMTCADVAKARQHLNYKPSVDIQTGLVHFADWMRTRTC